MNLQYYPFDTNVCTLEMESCKYLLKNFLF